MSVQQKQKQKTKNKTLLHFHVTKMAIINSGNMEPPPLPPTQKRNKQTNKNILSPAQLFSFVGILVGVVCHWKVGNYN